MRTTTLGRSGLTVSRIAFGTWQLGGDWGATDEKSATAAIRQAADNGVTFFDTAQAYGFGASERLLAEGLRGRPREDLVIATKGGLRPGGAGLVRDAGAEWIRKGVDESLRALDTDYIDLYQIHWPQRNVPNFGATEFDPAKEKDGPSIHEQVKGMAAMIKAGKIRHYGLSNESAWGVCKFQEAAKALGVPGPVTIQNSYSLISRNVDSDLAETLFRENMSLLAYSPLAAGILSGKYMGGAKPAGTRFVLFDSLGIRFRKPMVSEAVDAYAGLARRRGMTLVELALGYVNSRWFLGASIIGATKMDQLKEDIAAAQVELDKETVQDIREIQYRYPNPAG